MIENHAQALLIAIGLDLILGDPETWPHPVRWMGFGYTWGQHFFKNASRFQGGLLVCLISMTFVLPLWILLSWIHHYSAIAFLGIESILFYFCLSFKSLIQLGTSIHDDLKRHHLAHARQTLSHLVGRETDHLSSTEITRATLESLSESFIDGFLSPIFWGLLGGVPLAFLFKVISTGDSMIGHPDPPYQRLGWAVAKLDDLFNFFPARLSILFIAPATLWGPFSFRDCLRVFFSDRRCHPSPNAAHAESAFAGALQVRLGGINVYEGQKYVLPFLNASASRPKSSDLLRGLRLLKISLGGCLGMLFFLIFLKNIF
jgi:adenosylcobinamide-phosphate synthase